MKMIGTFGLGPNKNMNLLRELVSNLKPKPATDSDSRQNPKDSVKVKRFSAKIKWLKLASIPYMKSLNVHIPNPHDMHPLPQFFSSLHIPY
jgi:hypothetical protein